MTRAVFPLDKSHFAYRLKPEHALPSQKHLFQFVRLVREARLGLSTSKCVLPITENAFWKIFVKQSNFLTGNCNTPESFICVCFAIIHGDQSPCLGPQCQRETSMTSPIHTASSPHISHALSRHIPQQRETPRVTIHQTKPFMAHQKTMNCQSERSVCNMK